MGGWELNENHLPTVSPFSQRKKKQKNKAAACHSNDIFRRPKLQFIGRSVKVEPQRKRFSPFDELIRRVIYDSVAAFDEANKPRPPQNKLTNGRYQPHKTAAVFSPVTYSFKPLVRANKVLVNNNQVKASGHKTAVFFPLWQHKRPREEAAAARIIKTVNHRCAQPVTDDISDPKSYAIGWIVANWTRGLVSIDVINWIFLKFLEIFLKIFWNFF